ncbi:hypothetical protein BHE74_00021234 [Ensete ventricosum]|nr:hypothetical protein GW17_00036577 [Ensete ventricosum]RWW71046.1 hypothetical protein BHE74_00021234 [Ensete ventricosum]
MEGTVGNTNNGALFYLRLGTNDELPAVGDLFTRRKECGGRAVEMVGMAACYPPPPFPNQSCPKPRGLKCTPPKLASASNEADKVNPATGLDKNKVVSTGTTVIIIMVSH